MDDNKEKDPFAGFDFDSIVKEFYPEYKKETEEADPFADFDFDQLLPSSEELSASSSTSVTQNNTSSSNSGSADSSSDAIETMPSAAPKPSTSEAEAEGVEPVSLPPSSYSLYPGQQVADFSFPDDFVLPIAKTDDAIEKNLEALSVLNDVVSAYPTPATKEQMLAMASYTGWGNSTIPFSEKRRDLSTADAKRQDRLFSLLRSLSENLSKVNGDIHLFQKDEDYSYMALVGGVRESTDTQFDTYPRLAKAINNACFEMLGHQPSSYAEIGASIGNFTSATTGETSNRVAVEPNPVSAALNQFLHPNVKVMTSRAEDLPTGLVYYDMISTNIPFGSNNVTDMTLMKDPRFPSMSMKQTNYFPIKILSMVNGNGISAFIAPKGFLDNPESMDNRKYLSANAEFIGALRMPQNMFDNAKAVTDVIFVRKKDSQERNTLSQSFVDTVNVTLQNDEGEDANLKDLKDYEKLHFQPIESDGRLEEGTIQLAVNRYYVEHPEFVLGDIHLTRKRDYGRYGDEKSKFGYTHYTFSSEGKDELCRQFEEIAGRMVSDYKQLHQNDDLSIKSLVVSNLQTKKPEIDYSAFYENYQIFQEAEHMYDQYREILDKGSSFSSQELENKEDLLRKSYSSFKMKYGSIHDPNTHAPQSAKEGVLQAFQSQHYYPVICCLEKRTSNGSYVLDDRLFNHTPSVDYSELKFDSPQAVVDYSMEHFDKVDVPFMESQLGSDWEEQCKGLVFYIPAKQSYEDRDNFLSGFVFDKIKYFDSLSKFEPKYAPYVDELNAVLPQSKSYNEISVSLDSDFLTADIIRAFVSDESVFTGGKVVNIQYGLSTKTESDQMEKQTWIASIESESTKKRFFAENKDRYCLGEVSTKTTSKYMVDPLMILNHALNNTIIKVKKASNKTSESDGDAIDQLTTDLANEKVARLRDQFPRWLADEENLNWQEKVVDLYNKKFNSYLSPKQHQYDVNIPSCKVSLYDHQKNAVSHIVHGNNVLLKHDVGYGKTYTMIAAAQHMHDMGIRQKSLIVCLKSNKDQIVASYYKAFPNARLFVCDEDNFSKGNFPKFCESNGFPYQGQPLASFYNSYLKLEAMRMDGANSASPEKWDAFIEKFDQALKKGGLKKSAEYQKHFENMKYYLGDSIKNASDLFDALDKPEVEKKIKEFYEENNYRVNVFMPTTRQAQTLREIALADVDCVIMTHDQFGEIPIDHDMANNAARSYADDFFSNILDYYKDSSDIPRTLLNKINRYQGRKCRDIESKINSDVVYGSDGSMTLVRKSDLYGMSFRSLGIDQVFVDEAHVAKNLAFESRYNTGDNKIKGLGSANGNQITYSLYSVSRYLSTIHGQDKGLVLATATPYTNGIAEIHTMAKYLAPEKLRINGISNFDSFLSNCCVSSNVLNRQINGKYKTDTRIVALKNVDVVVDTTSAYSDIVKKSEITFDLPSEDRHEVKIMASEADNLITKELVNILDTGRSDFLGVELTPKERSATALILGVMGQKLSLTPRMMTDDREVLEKVARESKAEYDKVEACIKGVIDIYNKTKDHPGSQLIFSDLFSAKYADNEEETDEEGGEDNNGDNSEQEEVDALMKHFKSNVKFHVFNYIRDELVKAGIPSTKICILSGQSNAQRRKLIANAEAGRYNVIMGSTKTAGTGLNIQKNGIAVHMLDTFWNWTPIQQRLGRFIRQGNEWAKNHGDNKVNTFFYIKEKSADANKYQYSYLKKAVFDTIDNAEKGHKVLNFDDKDEKEMIISGLRYASGDPLHAELTSEQSQARIKSSAYEDELHVMKSLTARLDNSEHILENAYKANDECDNLMQKVSSEASFSIGGVKDETEIATARKLLTQMKEGKPEIKVEFQGLDFKVRQYANSTIYYSLELNEPEVTSQSLKSKVSRGSSLSYIMPPSQVISRLTDAVAHVYGFKNDNNYTINELNGKIKGLNKQISTIDIDTLRDEANKHVTYYNALNNVLHKEDQVFNKKLQFDVFDCFNGYVSKNFPIKDVTFKGEDGLVNKFEPKVWLENNYNTVHDMLLNTLVYSSNTRKDHCTNKVENNYATFPTKGLFRNEDNPFIARVDLPIVLNQSLFDHAVDACLHEPQTVGKEDREVLASELKVQFYKDLCNEVFPILEINKDFQKIDVTESLPKVRVMNTYECATLNDDSKLSLTDFVQVNPNGYYDKFSDNAVVVIDQAPCDRSFFDEQVKSMAVNRTDYVLCRSDDRLAPARDAIEAKEFFQCIADKENLMTVVMKTGDVDVKTLNLDLAPERVLEAHPYVMQSMFDVHCADLAQDGDKCREILNSGIPHKEESFLDTRFNEAFLQLTSYSLPELVALNPMDPYIHFQVGFNKENNKEVVAADSFYYDRQNRLFSFGDRESQQMDTLFVAVEKKDILPYLSGEDLQRKILTPFDYNGTLSNLRELGIPFVATEATMEAKNARSIAKVYDAVLAESSKGNPMAPAVEAESPAADAKKDILSDILTNLKFYYVENGRNMGTFTDPKVLNSSYSTIVSNPVMQDSAYYGNRMVMQDSTTLHSVINSKPLVPDPMAIPLSKPFSSADDAYTLLLADRLLHRNLTDVPSLGLTSNVIANAIQLNQNAIGGVVAGFTRLNNAYGDKETLCASVDRLREDSGKEVHALVIKSVAPQNIQHFSDYLKKKGVDATDAEILTENPVVKAEKEGKEVSYCMDSYSLNPIEVSTTVKEDYQRISMSFYNNLLNRRNNAFHTQESIDRNSFSVSPVVVFPDGKGNNYIYSQPVREVTDTMLKHSPNVTEMLETMVKDGNAVKLDVDTFTMRLKQGETNNDFTTIDSYECYNLPNASLYKISDDKLDKLDYAVEDQNMRNADNQVFVYTAPTLNPLDSYESGPNCRLTYTLINDIYEKVNQKINEATFNKLLNLSPAQTELIKKSNNSYGMTYRFDTANYATFYVTCMSKKTANESRFEAIVDTEQDKLLKDNRDAEKVDLTKNAMRQYGYSDSVFSKMVPSKDDSLRFFILNSNVFSALSKSPVLAKALAPMTLDEFKQKGQEYEYSEKLRHESKQQAKPAKEDSSPSLFDKTDGKDENNEEEGSSLNQVAEPLITPSKDDENGKSQLKI